jgi:hypothetical protein
MCQEFSVVVNNPPTQAYIAKSVWQHSHSQICAEHKISCDKVFKFEVVPKAKAGEVKDFSVVPRESYSADKHYEILEDTVPPGGREHIDVAKKLAWKAFKAYWDNSYRSGRPRFQINRLKNDLKHHGLALDVSTVDNRAEVYDSRTSGYCIRISDDELEVWFEPTYAVW